MAQTNVQVFSGNVGIGTTDPVSTLQVFTNSLGSTTGDSTDIFRFGGDSNGAGTLLLTAERLSSGSNWTSTGLRLQRIVDTTKMAYVQFGSNTGDASGELLFGTGGATERMRIASGGGVGIGVTNPVAFLDVAGSANSGKSLQLRSGDDLSTTDSSQIIFTYNGSPYNDAGYAHSIRTRHNSGGDSGNAIDFWLWNSTDTTNENTLGNYRVMTMEGTGNVGIGTASPVSSLHVQTTATGAIGGTVILNPTMNSTNMGLFIGKAVGTGTCMFVNYTHSGTDDSDDNTSNLGIYGKSTNLTLKGNGNVGIGTAIPRGTLHIYEPTGTSHGAQVGTIVLEHGNNNGSSSIVFPSRANYTSDYGYITYNENYGEAGVSTGENGVLLLGSENDGTVSSDHVRVKGRLVVEAALELNQPTYAFQVKSSNITSDLFNVHRGGSVGINANDPNIPFTIETNKYITVNGTNYNSFCRWFRGAGNWYVGSDYTNLYNQNLYWFANLNASGNPIRPVITFENDESKNTIINANSFTGQHRNVVRGVNPTTVGTYTGLIVSADNNENIKVNGGVERGLKAITINETIPYVSVTTKAYDKQVFGVVSGSEDPESRQDTLGRVTSTFTKEEGDDRIFINSLGEGAMWISNQNGPLTSGDYVTSSHIPGYGMKQDSEFLANYTVAKITMDCDFLITPRIKYKIKTEFKTVDYYRFDTDLLTEKKYNLLDDETKQKYTLEQYEENVNILDEHGQLQWEDSGETEDPYHVRYLLPDGTQISEEEYTTRALADEKVYIAAFVGCTYHCG